MQAKQFYSNFMLTKRNKGKQNESNRKCETKKNNKGEQREIKRSNNPYSIHVFHEYKPTSLLLVLLTIQINETRKTSKLS